MVYAGEPGYLSLLLTLYHLMIPTIILLQESCETKGFWKLKTSLKEKGS